MKCVNTEWMNSDREVRMKEDLYGMLQKRGLRYDGGSNVEGQ